MTTHKRAELIDALIAVEKRSWAEEALLHCLQRLGGGGPTEWRLVTVHDAWPDSELGGFAVIYESPWGETVGLQVSRFAEPGEPLYLTQTYAGPESETDPAEFGFEIADYCIAVPNVGGALKLTKDTDGLSWWGSRPLPPAQRRIPPVLS